MPSDPETAPPLASLRVVVDATLERDELRVHPAMFDLLRQAFMEADHFRNLDHLRRIEDDGR